MTRETGIEAVYFRKAAGENAVWSEEAAREEWGDTPWKDVCAAVTLRCRTERLQADVFDKFGYAALFVDENGNTDERLE